MHAATLYGLEEWKQVFQSFKVYNPRENGDKSYPLGCLPLAELVSCQSHRTFLCSRVSEECLFRSATNNGCDKLASVSVFGSVFVLVREGGEWRVAEGRVTPPAS